MVQPCLQKYIHIKVGNAMQLEKKTLKKGAPALKKGTQL